MRASMSIEIASLSIRSALQRIAVSVLTKAIRNGGKIQMPFVKNNSCT
jgi:hypothetical protein